MGYMTSSIHYIETTCACMLSHFSPVQLFVTPWTVTCQAPLSMGFSRQEYWSGLPCPPPGDLPNPGTKPSSYLLLCWRILYHQRHLGSPEQGIRCKNIESESRSDVSDSFPPHGLYSSWDSLGQNTGVGSLFLLQGIFPSQGLNLGLPHCRQILYQLSHKGSKKIIQPEKDDA